MESTAVQTGSSSEEEWVEGTCDARLYDELSSYVATPAFLKAFEQVCVSVLCVFEDVYVRGKEESEFAASPRP